MKDPYKILGLRQEATEKEIKVAFRKLALKYHPDRNADPGARERFEEINEAYEMLLERGYDPHDQAESYDDSVAREVLRREQEKRRQQARARQKKKAEQEAFLQRPEWYDPMLLVKYLVHFLAVLMALGAVLGPILYAILGTYESLAGTFFFIVAGVVLCLYIYERRKTWFRLGKFKTTWKDVRGFLKMEAVQQSKDRCCYIRGQKATGKPCRIELVRTLDIKMRNFGFMNHQVKYKNQVRKVKIPRSARAMVYHRISSLIKLLAILLACILLPVDSLSWRFLGGILAGGAISWAVLALAGVKSKVAYLFTPYLFVKASIWLGSLIAISEFGPGFSVQTSETEFFFLFALLFLLDMILDLLLSFLPFYSWFFKPIIKQGKIMDRFYRESYRNYQELPVYSVFYPFFRWLF